MSRVFEFRSRSPEETRALGARLGRRLKPGDVVGLCGALGAGKTEFIKGLALGLGAPDDEPVQSPTFVLAREYAGRLRLVHVDAYRLASAEELHALGWEEWLAEGAVLALEWADRFPSALPEDAILVELEHAAALERDVRITAPAGRHAMLVGLTSSTEPRP
jgi:tRNA threonylcarbamoyladenosine biosynthesis protein TsaE